MTGKDRINRLLRREPGVSPGWTTLVDPPTIRAMPDEVKALSPLQFYRHVGCDILQFGGYGMEGVTTPCRLVQPEVAVETLAQADGTVLVTTRSRWGTLTAISQNGHPVKHPVETLADLRVLRTIWAHSFYEEDTTDAFERNTSRIVSEIGEAGIMVNTIGPSPVQQLLEMDCGLVNFYSLYNEHAEELQELLCIMHDRRRREYEILAKRTPLECVIPVENTSTLMISPHLYEKLSLPQITDYVDILHRHNKRAVLHMCGHLKHILSLIRDTGCDGINAVTPPALGDTPYEDVLDCCGEDFLILGALFNPFQEYRITREMLWRELERTYTPRIRAANLLLWLGADGQVMPYERFAWVREWFEKQR